MVTSSLCLSQWDGLLIQDTTPPQVIHKVAKKHTCMQVFPQLPTCAHARFYICPFALYCNSQWLANMSWLPTQGGMAGKIITWMKRWHVCFLFNVYQFLKSSSLPQFGFFDIYVFGLLFCIFLIAHYLLYLPVKHPLCASCKKIYILRTTRPQGPTQLATVGALL